MARPWSRALGPYRFWTRPSTSSVSTSFICTNKHGSELEKGGEGEIGNGTKEGGSRGWEGRSETCPFLFIYLRGDGCKRLR